MNKPGLYLDDHKTRISIDDESVIILTDYTVTPPHETKLTPAMLGSIVTYVADKSPVE